MKQARILIADDEQATCNPLHTVIDFRQLHINGHEP